MNTLTNQEVFGNKKMLIRNTLVKCIKMMHVVKEWAYIGLPMVEEIPSNTLQEL
jgi:hypothetical protein